MSDRQSSLLAERSAAVAAMIDHALLDATLGRTGA
jgi:hypothetical protein